MYKFLMALLGIVSTVYATIPIECRIVTDDIRECNPYTARHLHAKEIKYYKNSRKLINVTLLPSIEDRPLKVVSVEEMLHRYTIHDSLRYKAAVPRAPQIVIHQESALELEEYEEEGAYESIEENPFIVMDEEAEAAQKMTEPSRIEGIYIVVQGDVLGRIAKKFNMKTQELRDYNRLKKGSILRIGQRLKIPMAQEIINAIVSAKYKVKFGDTLEAIAKKFNLDLKLLASYNKIRPLAILKKGRVLDLPFPYKLQEIAEQKKYGTYGTTSLRVTATAYTSHPDQTSGDPFLGAWNNRLVPGSKIIAVSSDLLKAYGLRNGKKVRISGLPGIYTVRDKMHKRFKKRIDIYMGLDKNRAYRWGRRSVIIYWD